MDSTGAIYDILMLGLGIYLFYVWFLMNYKNEIKEQVLLSPHYPYKRCKDKEGYKAYIGKRLICVSIACAVSGALGIYNGYTGVLGTFGIIPTGICMAAIIWFAVAIRKSNKKFW